MRKTDADSADHSLGPIFVHSRLDDYGLTLSEFRVYARVARRAGAKGKHCESVPRVARALKLSIRTVQYSLQLLTESGLISRRVRNGTTNEYSINPLANWGAKENLEGLKKKIYSRGATLDSGAINERPATSDLGPQQPQPKADLQSETDESTPLEGTPLESTPFEGIPSKDGPEDSLSLHKSPNPTDFVISDALRQWAWMNAPSVDVDQAHTDFVIYWSNLSGASSGKLSRDQAFQDHLRGLHRNNSKKGRKAAA